MDLGGAAAVPQQPERRFQRQPPAPLPACASLPRQPFSFCFAQTLLLAFKGQL
jgi:hypothetical protein